MHIKVKCTFDNTAKEDKIKTKIVNFLITVPEGETKAVDIFIPNQIIWDGLN